MDLFSTMTLLMLAGCLLIGIVLGYVIGSRRSRRSRRELQQNLNSQSLQLLDAKSETNRLGKFLAQSKRKDRLLKLILRRLQAAETKTTNILNRANVRERQHYVQLAKLRMIAVQSHEKSRRAALIAQRAMAHVKRVELSSPATQTISAPEPKSYGQGESVTVSVVDQHTADCRQDSVSRVSHRDSARLATLRSSNEGKCFNPDNLQAIHGIGPDMERSLNQAGIHRLEQLANLSDGDLDALGREVGHDEMSASGADWVGGARELLKQKQPG